MNNPLILSGRPVHRLLKRQMRRHLAEGSALEVDTLTLLAQVNDAYWQMDEDRVLLERSLELSSSELNQRYEELNTRLGELKLAQGDLEYALSELEATLDATEDGILVVDLIGRVLRANERFYTIWSIDTAHNIVGGRMPELLKRMAGMKDLGECMRRLRDVLADPAGCSRDTMLLNSGKVIECYSQPQQLKGEIVGRVWSFSDITQRRQAEERLRLSARVIESTSEGVVVTDAQANIVSVNPAFCDIMGIRAEQALGQRAGFTKSGRHDDGFYHQMWQQINSDGKWQGEIWDRRANGEVFPKWLSITAIYDDENQLSNYIGVFSDISSIKQTEQRLRHLAYYDQLTGLPNRALLQERLESRLLEQQRDGGKAALIYLDLDRFKVVNDSLGHLSGDRLLQQAAERLRHSVRESDTVARMGGDEFTVLLRDINGSDNAAAVAKKIVDEISAPFDIGGQVVYIGASVGICILPDDAADMQTALKVADTAMYQAKAEGKGCYQFFNPELNRLSGIKIQLQADLQQALTHDELVVFYQPQVDARSGRLHALEALVRWQHPDRGLVMPDQFIALAEESSLITMIGRRVLSLVCRQIVDWQRSYQIDVPVSVNLSAKEFLNRDLSSDIKTIIEREGVDPRLLEFEITETSAMGHADRSAEIMYALKQMGVKLSIDDFGTGYSSLAYLKRFPVSKLKVDRSFVRDITVDSNDAAIVKSVISLADALGLQVVAEGVETEQQLAMLRGFGCAMVQGYYYSRPLPAADIEQQWLQAGRCQSPYSSP